MFLFQIACVHHAQLSVINKLLFTQRGNVADRFDPETKSANNMANLCATVTDESAMMEK